MRIKDKILSVTMLIACVIILCGCFVMVTFQHLLAGTVCIAIGVFVVLVCIGVLIPKYEQYDG